MYKFRSWEDAYNIKKHVFDFSHDPLSVSMAFMQRGDIPVTAAHMHLVESYPNNAGVLDGNYS